MFYRVTVFLDILMIEPLKVDFYGKKDQFYIFPVYNSNSSTFCVLTAP